MPPYDLESMNQARRHSEKWKTKDLLDHGYVKLVETYGSDEDIIRAARMSTQKGFSGWGDDLPLKCVHCDAHEPLLEGPNYSTEGPCIEGKTHDYKTQAGDEKLLRYLWTHKHATPFEFAGAILEIQAPIFVFREWHRHRTQSYNEMSARYAPLPDVNYIPTVERLMLGGGHLTKQAAASDGAAPLTEAGAESFQTKLAEIYKTTQALYEYALAKGVPKELARVVLPVGRYSRMRAAANLRNWLGFLSLRMAKDAQWEIRQYAGAVHDLLKREFPRTLALFDEERAPKGAP